MKRSRWSLFARIESFLSRKYVPHVLAFVVVIVLTLIVVLIPFDTWQLVRLGYGGIFLANLMGSLTVILPAPAILAAFAGGVWLNPLWAGLLAGLGSGLGETSGYLAGYSGRAIVEDKDLYNRLKAWMTSHGFVTLFVLAALPNPLFDAAGITAGVMGFPFLKFLVATCGGKMTKGLALAFLGAQSVDLFNSILR